MNFYIASGLKNVELVRVVSKMLTENGWVHTYDWTSNLNVTSSENMSIVAQKEFEGVKNADIVIVLNPQGRGTHTELGMAIALNKKVYIYDSDASNFNIDKTVSFYWLSQVNRLTGAIEETIKTILSDN